MNWSSVVIDGEELQASVLVLADAGAGCAMGQTEVSCHRDLEYLVPAAERCPIRPPAPRRCLPDVEQRSVAIHTKSLQPAIEILSHRDGARVDISQNRGH